jgi:hypothetical protein
MSETDTQQQPPPEKKKGKGKAKAKKQESSETTSNTNNNANTDDNSSSPPPPRLQTPNDIAQSIELRDSLSGKDKTGSSKSKGSGKKKKENTQEPTKKQITKTGFMHKQGGGKVSKSWKYRLFVLYGGVLSYYQVTNQKRELKGEIPLSSVKAVCVSEEVEQLEKEGKEKPERGYQFDVFTPNRIYKFAAESREEMNSWIEAIKSWLP